MYHDFKNWKIEVTYNLNQNIDRGTLNLNYALRVFQITIGLRPNLWKGVKFSAKDIPLIEEHEKGHCENYMSGTKPIESALMVVGNYKKEIERLKLLIDAEKNAWKRAFQKLHFEQNLDWLQKVHLCLNTYVFKCHERIERLKELIEKEEMER